MTAIFISPKAPKNTKKNQLSSSSKKEASGGTIPWPNIPQQQINLIGKQLHLMRNMYWAGVSKSWKAVPKNAAPNERRHGSYFLMPIRTMEINNIAASLSLASWHARLSRLLLLASTKTKARHLDAFFWVFTWCASLSKGCA